MIQSFWEQHKNNVTKLYLSSVKGVEVKDNVFYFRDVNSLVAIYIISDDIFRVRLAPQGVFLPDFSYALSDNKGFQLCDFEFNETEDHYSLTTATTECRVIKSNFKIQFYDKLGHLINEDDAPLHWEENVEYGGYYVFAAKKIQPDENFYGLGDKSGDLNLVRSHYTNWSTDAYAFERGTDPLYRNIPFYIGLHGGISYGLWYDNTYKTHFDFGKEENIKAKYVAEGGELNYYFINGPHMMDVVKRYHSLTGTAPMPPMWALGYHQCRWSYYPESKIDELAKEFRERQIPCDALYLDIDYMDGYRCFTWNKDYFPDPISMNARLKRQGFKTVVILDPGIKIDDDYFVYKEGKEKGYFCRRGDDYFMEGPVWPGRCQFPDFTHPEVRQWWGDLCKIILEEGVDGIWTDMNEPSVFGLGTFLNDVRHYYEGYRGSHRKAHNIYGMQMARATYEGVKRHLKSRRPFIITRSCYSGVQRFSSCWTGDNVGSWDHLLLASVQCQRMSMSGISFVGSDIGGFTGNADGELFTRWIQLGVFSPLMRAHSSGDTREREPWSYGPEFEAIIKKYIELRYKLLPYIYSAFWENHKYGFPILRPVVMIEQEKQSNTWRQDEFTFGDKILVCPVLQQGAQGRTVYLPKGEWYHLWTNKLYAGGQEIWIDAPIDQMPIFVRAGSVVPEYPLMQYTGEFDIKELTLNVYFTTGIANSFMYEDHGDTFAYEQDIYTEKKFVTSGKSNTFMISQSAKGLFTPRYDTYKVIIQGLPFAVKSVEIDGKAFSEYYQNTVEGPIEFSVFKSFEKIEILG